MAENKSTALMKHEEIGNKFPALIAGQSKALQIMQESLDEDDINIFSLTKIKIVPGGVGQFVIVYASGKEEVVPNVTGVAVLRRKIRGYWPDGQALGGPPSCFSNDTKTGIGDIVGNGIIETHYCKVCPMAQFGSSSQDGVIGKGQACQLRNLLFFLREGKTMPDLLNAPPTSAGIVAGLIKELAGDELYMQEAVIKVTLMKKENDNKKPYSVLQFEKVGTLSEQQKIGASAMHQAINNLFGETKIDPEILNDEPPKGKPVDSE